jgi:hypothetical protein
MKILVITKHIRILYCDIKKNIRMILKLKLIVQYTIFYK